MFWGSPWTAAAPLALFGALPCHAHLPRTASRDLLRTLQPVPPSYASPKQVLKSCEIFGIELEIQYCDLCLEYSCYAFDKTDSLCSRVGRRETYIHPSQISRQNRSYLDLILPCFSPGGTAYKKCSIILKKKKTLEFLFPIRSCKIFIKLIILLTVRITVSSKIVQL